MVSIAFHPEPDSLNSCDYIVSANSDDWQWRPMGISVVEHCGEPSVSYLQITWSDGGTVKRHCCRKHASIEQTEWQDFLPAEAEIQTLAEALVPGDKEGQSFARMLIGP